MEPRAAWGDVFAVATVFADDFAEAFVDDFAGAFAGVWADGVAEDWTGTSAGCWLMAPFFRAKRSSCASERAVGEGSLPLGRTALPGLITDRFIA
ncbi:hypothetical protein GCM10010230_21170 [Streptomyces narbonensis]|nr:hypothetical protein GCM10010230_21170 [Streptomyces narbonensis]